MSSSRCVLLMVALSSWAAGAVGDEVSKTPPVPPEIAAAIRRLDDDSYVKREEATQFLWAAGKIAEPALQQTAAHGDPESRARAQRVLEKIRYGIYPSTPPEIAELVNQYNSSDAEARQTIVGLLSDKGGYGILVLARLREETEGPLRERISELLTARAGKAAETAAILVAGDDFEAAERMLEEAAGVSGDESATRAYAAYLLCTGKLAPRLALFQKAYATTPDAKTAKQLAIFLRATGDYSAALAAAGKAGDARLTESLLLESHQWSRLAASLTATGEATEDIRRAGLIAAVQRFAGDDAGFNASLIRLRQLSKRGDTQGQAVMALLLNDQVDAGLAVQLERKSYLSAFDVYCYSARYTDAIALVDRAIGENHPDAMKLRAVATRILWRLGEHEKAQALLDVATTDNARRKEFGVSVYLCETEKEIGHADRARAHAVAALESFKHGDNLPWLFSRLFPGQETAAETWWSFLQTRFDGQPVDKRFDILSKIMGNQLPAGELDALAEQMLAAIAPADGPARERSLGVLADTLRNAGRQAAAGAYSDQLAGAHEARGDLAYVADRLIQKKEWLGAAEAYERVSFRPADFPEALWMRGYALLQAGHEKEGKAAMDKAKLIPLADERRRHDLAEVMAAHGHEEDARLQRELILRTGPSRGWYFYESAKQLGNDAARCGDYLKASEYWQLFLLQVLDDGGAFLDEKAYLDLPQLVHRNRARGLLAHHDTTGALRELRAYLAIAPASAQLAIDFVPEFEKAGHRPQADELFQLVLSNLTTSYGAFPGSAYFHNDIAWACTLCNREPELALKHALRAAELAPGDTNCLDTLAEVYFRAGRLKDAEAILETCIKLEPHQERHRQRLAGFKAGKGFSQ